MGIDDVLARMQAMLLPLEERRDGRRFFHATYLRTTQAVAEEVRRGGFQDPAWLEQWDVAFANLYLDALEARQRGEETSRPWAVAFGAAAEDDLPPLRHVLLGMNAHINYDLPQALLAVIGPADFDDPVLLDLRQADHEHVDRVLASRVRDEDAVLGVAGPVSRLDRLLGPLNRLGTRRFLRESRAKVWANARRMDAARRQGHAPYAATLAELEALSAARVSDLRAPGQVLLRLAVRGFGVELPGAGGRP